jgi:hypothetical protein
MCLSCGKKSENATQVLQPCQDYDALPVHRVFFCACCGIKVAICTRCDRGHVYCKLCAVIASNQRKKKARIKFRKSPNGRKAHAKQQKRYRKRKEVLRRHDKNDVRNTDLAGFLLIEEEGDKTESVSQSAGDSGHDSVGLIAFSESNVEQPTPTASQATPLEASRSVGPISKSYEATEGAIEDLSQQSLGTNLGAAMPTMPSAPGGALLDELTSLTCAGSADTGPTRSASTAIPTASQAPKSQESRPVRPHSESCVAMGGVVEDLSQQSLGTNSGAAMPTMHSTPGGALLDELASPTYAGSKDTSLTRSDSAATPTVSQATPAQALRRVGPRCESNETTEIIGSANQSGVPVPPATGLLGKFFPEETESDRGSLAPTTSDIPSSAPALEPGSGDPHDEKEAKAEESKERIVEELAGPTCSFCGTLCSKWCRTGGRQWREEKKFAPHSKRKKEGDP